MTFESGTAGSVRGATIVRIVGCLAEYPEEIAQLDVRAMLKETGFWDNIPDFSSILAFLLNARSESLTAWYDLQPGVKSAVLGDRVGEVLAFGHADRLPETTCYLVLLEDGLVFQPALTQEQITTAGIKADKLEAAVLSAMQGELELFDFLVIWVTQTLDLNPDIEHMLREIRQTLWELHTRTWPPAERMRHLTSIMAAFNAIAKNSSLELEDILEVGRGALRNS